MQKSELLLAQKVDTGIFDKVDKDGCGHVSLAEWLDFLSRNRKRKEEKGEKGATAAGGACVIGGITALMYSDAVCRGGCGAAKRHSHVL